MINLRWRLRAMVLTVGACLSSVATQAATIVLHELPGFELSAAQSVAMNRAANFWASRITNDIQINLEVGFANLGSTVGAVSFNSPGSVFFVQEVYARLAARAASPVDAIAVANLSPLVAGSTAPSALAALRW